ncbi:uncharacterized protein LOC134028292 [Osmerus eperlanus]|uniref:uncharacterized protein LOC134028292 n=1 Tax=Osmerus eperlanus TaxID=29151 RepID=UPI002E162873
MFSKNKMSSSEIRGKGDNLIGITVIETLIPADLVTGPSIVREGDDVEFTCRMSDPQKVANSSFVHCYLVKNGAIVLVQVFDIQKMKAIFTIRTLSNAASGNYSCVLLLLDSLPKKDAELHGSTAVFLQVKERGGWKELVIGIVCTVGVILPIILVFCLYLHITKQGALQCCRGGTQVVVNEDLPFAEGDYNAGASNMEDEQCSHPVTLDEFSDCESIEGRWGCFTNLTICNTKMERIHQQRLITKT